MTSRYSVAVSMVVLLLATGITCWLGGSTGRWLPLRQESTALATIGSATSADPETDTEQIPPEVYLSPEQQVLANVKVAQVRRRDLSGSLRAAGKVVYDETRLSRIAARVDGRLDHLIGNAIGDTINQGQLVGGIFSPDLLTAEQELLVALAARQQINSDNFAVLSSTQTMLAAARQKLKLWGLSDRQIKDLERQGKPDVVVPIHAPLGG
ncbi:MAG: efflux RND transporter periplasmic adaptor subunit, partial [Cyanobacteria bacterium NC_groundwater_1444_Ag_S-0.65um_54_12]|nr:efflux RND transporter periplasmic adaptor subunit [Cyanobacteria bacterium NC_groundwater_1444_Ag_S-0.65um_54_12]